MNEPVDVQECQECRREYPLLVKHWGKQYIGICRTCQKEEKEKSRETARSYREVVILRAAGKCEACGFYCPHILRIHHIKPVSALGHGYPSNLIALCPNCHAIVHVVRPGSKHDESKLYGLDLWLQEAFEDRPYKMLCELICGRLEYTDGRWRVPGLGDDYL